jgi:hypothetical protein
MYRIINWITMKVVSSMWYTGRIPLHVCAHVVLGLYGVVHVVHVDELQGTVLVTHTSYL